MEVAIRLATQQPGLFPWAGFWHRLVNVDVYGMLVDVQFEHGGFQNRVMLGDSWLTVPIAKEDRHKQIRHVRLADRFQQRDLIKLIRGRLPKKKYPYADDRLDEVFAFLDGWQYSSFHIIAESLTIIVARILGIETPLSLIPPAPYDGDTKNDRLWEHVARIQEHPGTYVCGAGTASFIDLDDTRGWQVDLQKEIDEADDERYQSVLYWIGKYEDPLAEMCKHFELVPLTSGGYGAAAETSST